MKNENIYTDEELYWMTGGDAGTLPTRIIPSEIYSLAPNEVFVFGSNALGMHHGGAARIAYNEFISLRLPVNANVYKTREFLLLLKRNLLVDSMVIFSWVVC